MATARLPRVEHDSVQGSNLTRVGVASRVRRQGGGRVEAWPVAALLFPPLSARGVVGGEREEPDQQLHAKMAVSILCIVYR